MKLSTCLTLAALALSTLSAAAYAQTSQTYHFGEGQTGVQPGNARPAPAKKHKPMHHRHHVPAQDASSRN
jgi:hypothetical protein